MAKGSTLEANLLKLIFQAVAIPNLADNAAASPITTLSVALHTADPTGGTQQTNEVAYAAYARPLTSRSSSTLGWTVTGSNPATASPLTAIGFPQCTSAGSSATVATYFSVGGSTVATSTGATPILYSGTITPSITLGVNVTPSLTTGSSITES